MWNTPGAPGSKARLALVTDKTDTVAAHMELKLGVRCRREASKPQLKRNDVQCQRETKAGAGIRVAGVGGVRGQGVASLRRCY